MEISALDVYLFKPALKTGVFGQGFISVVHGGENKSENVGCITLDGIAHESFAHLCYFGVFAQYFCYFGVIHPGIAEDVSGIIFGIVFFDYFFGASLTLGYLFGAKVCALGYMLTNDVVTGTKHTFPILF